MQKVDPNRIFTLENAAEYRSQLLSKVVDSIKQVQGNEFGYGLRFSPESEDLVLVSDWIQAERICNPFLRFNLTVESNKGPITCDLSGPSGTKNFLNSELGLNRWI